jgi:hypothetical protein
VIGAATALLIACGSGAAEPTPVPVTLTAEVCTEGQARNSLLHVKNLDDFEWRDITITLVKLGNRYSREWVSMAPDAQQPVSFTDAREFFYLALASGTGIGVGLSRETEQGMKRLHNFTNLESATIQITSPQPGEWTGEVGPCG